MSKKILIVDDDKETREEIAEALQDDGFEVVGADGVNAALTCTKAHTDISIVICDINLRDSSGLDLLSILKTDKDRDYEIIMVTGSTGVAEAIRALRTGAYDFILKPLDLDHLVHVVGRAIEHIERAQAAREAELALEGYADVLRSTNEKLRNSNQIIRGLLGRYVAENVVEQLLQSPESLHLGGKRQHVTVLISDLRGFTPITEANDAEAVVKMLNNYLGIMLEVIETHEGTIDNIVGDSIIATFGAPIENERHADQALACAVSMQLQMRTVNAMNADAGLPQIHMGIGIDSGDVIVGNIGSEKHAKYSVIGSPVNRASRIEAYTLGGQILTSRATLDQAQAVVRIDGNLQVQLKGIDAPVEILQVGGIEAPYDLFLPTIR